MTYPASQVPTDGSIPHGLRGLSQYPVRWEDLWPILVLVVLVILVLGLLFYLWRRSRQKPKAPLVPVDPFTVLESRLREMRPPEPFEGKAQSQYFFDLNMIFRECLELGLKFPATDLTLQELKEPLRRKSSLSRETTEEIIRFLERCDAIKFAGLSTDLHEAQESHLRVLEWFSYFRNRVSSPR